MDPDRTALLGSGFILFASMKKSSQKCTGILCKMNFSGQKKGGYFSKEPAQLQSLTLNVIPCPANVSAILALCLQVSSA